MKARLFAMLVIVALSIPTLNVSAQMTYKEAPMLAELVAAGQLPPVEERLPKPEDIMVVPVVDGIGQYGGTWYNVTGGADMNTIKMVLYDPPIRWKSDYTGYEPGLAKSYEWSEDGTEVTLRFREGVKWSDGEPFTMDDMRFWWEDLALNPDFKVVQVPWWGFKSDGTPMDVSFPDDYTMVMKWDRPQWITPYILAQGFWEWEDMMAPRHFLEQFHPKYNPDATYEDLEKKQKFEENPDFPVLFAWHIIEYTPAQRWVLERNPYYWKVDPEGNQLPYIDRMVVDYIPDEEVRVLEISQGKYDATFRGTQDPNNIPFLLEQAEANDFHIHEGAVNGAGGWPGWLINQDYADTTNENWEEIRAVLRDKNFRQGLSHAMDRQRIIDVAWDGIGYPTQGTISPQAWHFASEEGRKVYEEWRDSYIEYNPELAMQLFDTAGVVDADGDGCRDLPSGAAFTLVLDLTDWGTAAVNTPATEVFASNLKDVGICTLINNVIGLPDSDLRQREGLFMLRTAHGSELDIWTYPDWIFPLRENRAWPLEGKWRQTGGAEGEQPEEGSPAARLQALYDQGVAEPDIEKRHEIVWEAIRIHIEEGPFYLGAAGDQPMPVVVKNNFHGIPELVILGPWAPGSPGNLFPEQFWIEQ